MKIKTNTQPQGNAMLVTLLTAFVIGLTLASYLTMVSAQNQTTMRSLAWNSSVPATEAGIEEALTAIYYYGTTNLVAGGWTLNATDGFYHKTGDVGNGVSYDAGIKPPPVGAPDQPTIECLGYAPAPANLYLNYRSSFGMILGGLVPSYSPSVVSAKRKVRVLAGRQTPMQYAMLAKEKIDLNGNNITTDSFDYCTDGPYNPTTTTKRAKGDVATNSGLVNSLMVGNANLNGHVSTGPYGTVDIGSQGSVGDLDWTRQGKKGIEPGWVSDDCNMDIPDVKVPFTTGGTPLTNVQYPPGGPTYDFVLGSGNYKISDFHGKVLVLGNANLLVTSSFNFSGSDKVTINSGASLAVYVAAASASLGGNGIQNPGDPMSFIYYGLNSNTSLSFSGNAAFIGAVYAPYADFKLGGSGSTDLDFIGASVTRSVTLTGHFHFHYDECLARRFPIFEYVVSSWNEINPNK